MLSRVVIMRPVSYVLGLLSASTLLMWVDHSPSDVANQAAMLVLVVSAAALGFAWFGPG
jgi:hypothetical protein